MTAKEKARKYASRFVREMRPHRWRDLTSLDLERAHLAGYRAAKREAK